MEEYMVGGSKINEIKLTVLNTKWAVRTVQGPETMISAVRQMPFYARIVNKLLESCAWNYLNAHFLSFLASFAMCASEIGNSDDFVRIHWAGYTETLRVQTICNEAKRCSSLFQAQNKDLQSDATV